MGNFLTPFKKRKAVDSIETPFKFPSPLPSWPQGGGFAKGSIDLGGIEVCQASTFTRVWATHEGGQDNLGASFFLPSSLPNGFFMLASYAQPNNKPLFGWILAAKDTSNGASNLAKPLDFILLWSSESSNIKKDGNGYFWLPVAPDGYKSVGHIVTNTPDKPSVDNFRCVRDELTDECENDAQIWLNDKDGFSVYGLRPATRTIQSLGVWVGTFAAQPKNSSNSPSTISCLKSKNSNYFSSMPNLSQIQALVQTYSPVIYFHPDEIYLPSSTTWFFGNGGLLYQKDNPNPSPIDPTGSNLPQGGSNDGQYWLDLPVDDNVKEAVKKGDIPSSRPYLHIKPMLGATFTDIALWVYYPFNGPARAKVGVLNIKLGKIGQHAGDWEHVTLRISNFTGELWRAYFSEHSSGSWVDACQLEFENGNKFVAYSSLNGHAFYPKAGLYLQGSSDFGIGIRNEAAKGKDSMDTGVGFQVVSAEYLGPEAVAEPPWLNYMREWGPKITYNIANELKDVERILPKKLRRALENFVRSLPGELLGEEGPTGPKDKSSWTMDEKA